MMKRRVIENKKGLEMAFSTIVAFILALILLVLLILFLTNNFSNFKDKISLYIGSSNTDEIVKVCNLNVQQEQKYEYCCVNKTIKTSDKKKFESTCFNLLNQTGPSWIEGIEKLNCGGVC